MRLLKILLLTLISLAVLTFNARADERIPLWKNTYYGMSLNEVLSSVQGAQKVADNIKPPFSEHNMQALARLDNIEISGEHFSAWFRFSSDGLSQVTLSMLQKSSETNIQLSLSDLSTQFTKFSFLLNIRYGNQIKVTRQEFGPPISVWNAQWVSGLTNIDLNVNKNYVNISYDTQYAKDLKDL